MMSSKNNTENNFKLSYWAINNSSVIYVMIAIFLFLGLSAYFSLPREDFPEIKETKIYISVPFPGNTAKDIEKLITNPLEEGLKNVSNVVEIISNSQDDYGIITVEFDEDVSIESAKLKIKDVVDEEKSSEDWPLYNNVKVEPNVFDLKLSEEVPIMNINISGNYTVEKLKEYAEQLQEKIEDLPQIKVADIRGAQDKEIEVAVDIHKMMANKISFDDILRTIRNGNVTMSAGNVKNDGQRRTIRVLGEISTSDELNDFVIKTEKNSPVYLRDVATVSFKNEQRTTFAREVGQNVVMIDIKKRSGKNMIDAAKSIRDIVNNISQKSFPSDLNVSITNDSSTRTLNQVQDLVNNVIFGIILVVTILMFFLGFRNALFVGFAIPMSMFMSFMILSKLGYTLNTMILFGLIMGLGMLVDNGIVVVENVFRLMDEEGLSRKEAAIKGISEIAYPIIISTATTVAAFIPLGLWPGLMGEFMIFFPITLSIVLGSSLFVAIFMNSMLVSKFMSTKKKEITNINLIKLTLILSGTGIFIMIFGSEIRGLGSLMIFTAFLFWAYKFVINPLAIRFRTDFLIKLENFYQRRITHALKDNNVYWYFGLTLTILFLTFIAFGISVSLGRTKIEFFPDNKPNQIVVYIEYPQGTAIEKTNEITKVIENKIYSIINDEIYFYEGKNFLIESSVSQVGEGAQNPQTDGGSAAEMPHRAKISTFMREFKYRRGKDTELLRKKIQDNLQGVYPGVAISVEKEAVGPPSGYPINIEIKGDDYDELILIAENMRRFINRKNIAGIEELKIDVNKGKPSMEVLVDRKKAGELGVDVMKVGNQLRRSIFGEKAGIYKLDGDDYNINVRFNKEARNDINLLFNQKIIFKDQSNGEIREIPVVAIASQKNISTYSSIKHKNGERVVTVYSALKPGFTDAGLIISEIQDAMNNFSNLPSDVSIDYTGQIEEQNKEMSFLINAFFTGLILIILLLIFQFGGLVKPIIIMIAIFLSLIGVFGGLIVTGWSFVIIMTMMGIISLAGIVVNNGVVLLDYTQLLINRKSDELGIDDDQLLEDKMVDSLIVQAGRARLRPVLLTAITTILGLIPLAIGLNIDFFSLFTEFNPNLYIGGDNVIFWGPLAWTVIFGLFTATFLTLIIVPVLFSIFYRIKYLIHLKMHN